MGSSASCCTVQQEFKLHEKMKILLLGLENVGKTTIMNKISQDITIEEQSSGILIETVENKYMKFISWDLGGCDRIRLFWKRFFPGTQGIIFVIDPSNKEPMEEAKHKLDFLLQSEELKDAPLLVLVNKKDLRTEMNIDEIKQKLELGNIKDREWKILGICAITEKGLDDGFNWLSKSILKKKKRTN